MERLKGTGFSGLGRLVFLLLLVANIKVPVSSELDGTGRHLFFASKQLEEITADILISLFSP